MRSKSIANKDRFFFDAAIYGVFVCLAGLVLPILLLPIVKLSGYSEIVEEMAKAVVIIFAISKLPSFKMQIAGAVAFGLLFGVSENMFYLNNFFQLGGFDMFWLRFAYTVPMHVATTLVILFSGLAGKKWLIFGIVGATMLHILFNAFAIRLFM